MGCCFLGKSCIFPVDYEGDIYDDCISTDGKERCQVDTALSTWEECEPLGLLVSQNEAALHSSGGMINQTYTIHYMFIILQSTKSEDQVLSLLPAEADPSVKV